MLQFYEFTIPFHSVFKTGKGNFLQRKGVLIQYSDSSADLVVEASPLPGFSAEKLEDVKKACSGYKTELEKFLALDFTIEQLRAFLKKLPGFPSFQFALSFLGIEILSIRKNIPFYTLLQLSFSQKLKINQVIGAGNKTFIHNAVHKGVNEGFDTFKIKAPYPFGELPGLLKSLSHEYPHIQFRLDANQTWPVQELEKLSHLFSGLPVEYVEEPVTGIHSENLPDIIHKCFLPIALDESIGTFSALTSRLNNYPSLTVIIKPSFYGNLFDLFETISRFNTLLSNVIITTSIESRIGRSMVASVASVTGNSSKAHGLNTGQLFGYDLLDDFTISGGVLELPESGLWRHSAEEINTNLIDSFN